MKINKEEALDYHIQGRHGKIEVVPTKPCTTSRDLSLAYTPGVAEPCKEIAENDDDVFKYTAKGNLVAVVTNGTAVLGLGDIGPHAGKPVMEGKGVLFKRFADIDVFDIELKTKDPKEIIRTVQLLEPTFGGINLEDIKAPECFEIEEELKKTMNIPVFHDDQHGTAIISCAALINAVELTGKKMDQIRLVINGAGAAAIACAKLYVRAGVKHENIMMCDSKGVISQKRTDLNKYKKEFAVDTDRESLADALKDADVFVGLSVAGAVKKDMLKTMAPGAIVFAMANPDPEISYEDAIEARQDIIMATGRSDYPNQVNNVLGFPFIFRGALDVRATAITENMKMAAVRALASLAKEKVPDVVIKAYGGEEFSFGREYIIPKPFDPRVLWKVAPAVARAAVEDGVARHIITDWEAYQDELKERLGMSKEVIRVMIHKAQKNPKRIVYAEGEEEKIIRASYAACQEGIVYPILLGSEEKICNKIRELGFEGNVFTVVDPSKSEKYSLYCEELYKIRQRKGVSRADAMNLLHSNNYFASMMVQMGDADALISGLTSYYPETIRPALQCIGVKEGFNVVSGLYIMITKQDVYFFADTTVNINPTAEQLAEIAISSADTVKEFNIEPNVAMLSFSNFGSTVKPESLKVKKAVEIVKQLRPDINVDGEMQVDVAIQTAVREANYPFSSLKGKANVLIFPDLNSGNIAYKLMAKLGGAEIIGPVLMGIRKPVHVLQRGASIEDIINMTAIAAVEAV